MPIHDTRRTLYDTPVTVHDSRPGDAEAGERLREIHRQKMEYADDHMGTRDRLGFGDDDDDRDMGWR